MKLLLCIVAILTGTTFAESPPSTFGVIGDGQADDTAWVRYVSLAAPTGSRRRW